MALPPLTPTSTAEEIYAQLNSYKSLREQGARFGADSTCVTLAATVRQHRRRKKKKGVKLSLEEAFADHRNQTRRRYTKPLQPRPRKRRRLAAASQPSQPSQPSASSSSGPNIACRQRRPCTAPIPALSIVIVTYSVLIIILFLTVASYLTSTAANSHRQCPCSSDILCCSRPS